MIGRELKRILQKPAAFVCVIVYLGIMILGVESDLKMGYESGLLNLFWFTENFGVTAFIQTLVFPIAAAGNYFDERKGHYDWLMQTIYLMVIYKEYITIIFLKCKYEN